MNQREAFEKWMLQFHKDHDGEESNLYDYSWHVWKAATEIERESCAKVCDYYATAIDLRGNEYIRSCDCKQAAKVIRDRS